MKRLALASLFLFACNTTSTSTPPTPPASSAPPPPASASTSAPAASASASSASATSCTKDGDCSKFSSYCGDLPCACMPYLTSAGPPKCNQPNSVKCLVDPCQRKSAACQDGKCVITTAGSTTQ